MKKLGNPVISIGNSIPTARPRAAKRISFQWVDFRGFKIFKYPAGGTPGKTDFDVIQLKTFGITPQMNDAGNPKPDFVNDAAWDGTGEANAGVGASMSAIVTANGSFIPKSISPGIDLNVNGASPDDKVKFENGQDGFNWVHSGGTAVNPDMKGQAVIISSADNERRWITFIPDRTKEGKMTANLSSPSTSGNFDTNALAGGGALTFLLKITPTMRVKNEPQKESMENRHLVSMVFGNVQLRINASSTMTVLISDNNEETTVNLSQGRSAGSNEQADFWEDPIVISLTPVWNGLIVSAGHLDNSEVVFTASTFCPITKGLSIRDDRVLKKGWFKPDDMEDKEVTPQRTNWGSSIELTANFCTVSCSYMPDFFPPRAFMDIYMILPNESSGVSYNYKLYPVFSDNGTNYEIDLSNVTKQEDLDDGASGLYRTRLEFRRGGSDWSRYCPELFGFMLQITETLETNNLANDNGSFTFNIGGGGSWVKHITSASVSMTPEGTSGSLVVDCLDMAGQTAEPKQSIGALTMNLTGLGSDGNSAGGKLFAGLGYGVSRSVSNATSLCTVNLVGVEKKLQDIVLINPPFLDGRSISEAANYLGNIAGLDVVIHGNSTEKLPMSEDVNSARFDFKTGTPVQAAFDDILASINYRLMPMDGVLHIYECNEFGLPSSKGRAWSGDQTLRRVLSVDEEADFSNLRNTLIYIALRAVGQNDGSSGILNFMPEIIRINQTTNPPIPWAVCKVRAFPIVVEDAKKLREIAEKESKGGRHYVYLGGVTIPGKAEIRPFDTYNGKLIYGVTHNVDLQAKRFTTSIKCMMY